MRILVDTHVFLWWLEGDLRLPVGCRDLIAAGTNDVLVSAASAWEISTKVRIGKLPGAVEIAHRMSDVVESQGFEPLAITLRHAQRAGALPGLHRDPFDRMLAAQSQLEDLQLMTTDGVFDSLGVQRLWV
ncbi:MAG: type II toxin-antitoxin system VapC family toxin [Deltaproteobacteria bacterium]|nr:type II toxin-antitoxin system VapC family toxin [Deltaproteobacteria bacterium]